MAQTNFAALQPTQKIVWSKQLWQDARDNMFLGKYMGGSDAIIQRITELTRTEKGEQAVINLVADLVEDGVVGDGQREGMEEQIKSYSETISIDLISHQLRNTGKLADQKAVIDFRSQSRGRLAYWLSNRIDQLAFLTLAGIDYKFNTDGSLRASSTFSSLSFNSDVTAPSANRHLRINGSSIDTGNTSLITATDTLSYGHIVDIVTHAKTHYMRGVMAGGKEFFTCFVRPEVLAQLKKDPDYQRAIVTALPREMNNPFFSGGVVTVDGLVIVEHRLVYNTKGAPTGSKWGDTGDVDGTRMSICGAQSLGFVDLGAPEWNEKEFEYGSSQGISVDKMFGFLKPQFYSIYDKSVEDFSVLSVDVAI